MRDFLQAQAAGLPGEVTIQVSALDPNNQLPACAALEPFLPAATRAWGRISVGVRCDSPVTWTAYVQAQVSGQSCGHKPRTTAFCSSTEFVMASF